MKKNNNSFIWLIAGIGVVIAVGAILAITSTSKNNETSGDKTTEISEISEVSVSGEALPEYAPGGNDPAVGKIAPVLDGVGFAGNQITTKSDSPTLVVFLAHWCPHCQREVPQLVKWFKDGNGSSIDIVAVATATDPSSPNYPPSSWLAREEWPALWPVMVDDKDGSASKAYGLSGFPYFVLLDGEGRVKLRHSGEIETAVLEQAISEALSK